MSDTVFFVHCGSTLNRYRGLTKKTARSSPKISAGFTLLELVVVIVILGVLAVFASVRFQGSDGFSAYTYQNRMLSALRNLQQKAMQDTRNNICFQLNIIPSAEGDPAFGPPTANCGSGIDFAAPEHLRTNAIELSEDNVSLQLSFDGIPITSASVIGFDNLGRPISGSSRICASQCEILFAGEARVCIASEGYIYAC